MKLRSLHGFLKVLPVTILLLPAIVAFAAGKQQPVGTEGRYRFRHIINREGLNCTWIWNIDQDSRGYLWLSTMYGTYRYDGYEFQEYAFDNSRSGTAANVTFVREDRFGKLWFGTDDGLYRQDLRDNSYIHYVSGEDSPFRLSSDDILCMAETHDGTLWVGTANGLNVIEPRRQECRIIPSPEERYRAITSVVCLDGGDMVFGTNGGGVWRMAPNGEHTRMFPESSGYAIKDIFEDSSRNIWIAGDGSGLCRIAPDGAIARYSEREGNLSNDIVRAVEQDREGNVWAATEHGITIFSAVGQEFLYRRDNDIWGLNDNAAYSLLCDRDGAVWIGTFFGGINVTNARYGMFSDLLSASGDNILKGCAVSSITPAGDKILIGTENKGLFVYDTSSGHFSNCNHLNNALGNDNVHAVCVDSRNNLWVGNFYGGLNLMRGNGRFTTLLNIPGNNSSIPSNSVYSILEDRSGNLWIGTRYGGLCRYDYSSERMERFSRLPSWLFIWDIIEDYAGNIWLACYGDGIYKLYRERDYEPALIATGARKYINLCELDDGRILAGSEKEGITSIDIDDLSMRRYTSLDGLPVNTVYGILQDKEGNIWFSTDSGIYKSGKELDRFSNFTVSDGLPTNRFNYNACARIGDRLWFGSIDGVVGINPAAEESAVPVRQIRFNDLYIYDEKQAVGGGVLSADINSMEELVLRSNSLSWGVSYSCNVFDNNHIHYAYRLEGMDDEWHDAGTRNRIDFTGLGYGRYRLTLCTLDEEGRHSDNRCSLSVFIRPPWWISAIALVFYGLVVLGIAAYLLHLLLNNTRTRHAFELECLAREKDREINEMKLRFFVNVSHEFKTPLSLIIGPTDSFLEGNVPEGAEKKYFRVIKRNAEKLLDLINELLAFRELEHLELNVQPFYYRPFIESALSRYDWLFESKNIRVVINGFDEDLLIWADSDGLEKIVSNLISNAYKYTPAGGCVEINAEREEGGVCTVITNSGLGIDPEKLPHIFDRFLSGRTYDRYSSGVGLSYVRSLVELHGGEITAVSREGKYTSFRVVLPSRREETKPVDIVWYDPDIFDEPRLLPETDARFDDSEYLETERQMRVLVVDDDASMRNMLAEVLGRHFKVETAENTAEAFRIAGNRRIDVLVSDVMLGEGMNGLELCRELKNNIETSHILVILTTVLSDNNYREYGYNVGADVYITKPFEFSLVVLRVRNLLYNTWKARKNYRLDIDLSGVDIGHSDSDEQLLKRAAALVFENLADPQFGVDKLCNGLAVTQSTLYRKIKLLSGLSINEFIQNIRLKYAARLLRETSNTVSEISFDVGFSDSSYFSRAFRKCFGISPRQWREQASSSDGE